MEACVVTTKQPEAWSWDTTNLKGPAKWTCFHLYVILDIFSRYVVGWMVAQRDSTELAEQASGLSRRREASGREERAFASRARRAKHPAHYVFILGAS